MNEWLSGTAGVALGAGATLLAAWLPVWQGWRDERECGVGFHAFLCAPRFAGRRPTARLVIAVGLGLGLLLHLLWQARPDVQTWLPLSVFLTALLVLALGDLWEGWLPDVVTGPMTWLGLLWSPLVAAEERILGAVVGFGTLWLIALAGRVRTGRDTMGSGDIWMAGAIGGWLGVEPVTWVVLAALVLMLPVKWVRREEYGPLGVPLALAASAAVFWFLMV